MTRKDVVYLTVIAITILGSIASRGLAQHEPGYAPAYPQYESQISQPPMLASTNAAGHFYSVVQGDMVVCR